ncbi:MAG: M20/M25/M40 family metallo-hydrolase, partial [Methanoregulaceae archaeon]|nr:M20/M25/M40 family metallo-hydrolase [Methanoregulaceae archaeon]
WSHDPFSGDTEGGYVWGRGSTDMKGGCAALLAAFRTLVDRGIEPAADLAFVCDEETSGMYGIQCLLSKNLIKPCDCLIAEPTPALYPNIGQKGLCRIDLSFKGEPGHGSLYPVKGISAVMEAVKILAFLEELHESEYAPGPGMEALVERSERVLNECFGIDRAGEVLRRVMWNPGKIEGGEKANIVAQRCRLELDIRVPWGCGMEEMVDELVKKASRATAHIQSLSEPSLTPADTPLVATVCREISRVYGREAAPIVQWAASDARFLRKAGFSVIEYGPSDITRLHSIDERVPVEALGHAEEVYEGVIVAYGNGAGT